MKRQIFKLFILIGLTFFLAGCKKSTEKSLSLKLEVAKDVILPYSAPILDLGKTIIRYYDDAKNQKEYVTVWDAYSSKLVFFDLQDSQRADSIRFGDIFKNQDGANDYYIQNWDSIFILSRNTNLIVVSDSAKAVKNKWEVNQPMEDRNLNYIIYNLGPITYQDKKVYALQGTLNIKSIANKEDRKTWFSQNNGAIIDLSGEEETVNNKTGAFPEQFQKAAYNTYNPFSTVNNKGEYIFTYSPFAVLYIYQPNGNLTIKEVKSRFHKAAKAIPEDSLMYQNFAEQYSVVTPQYLTIQYDKYRDLYYRFYYHGTRYDNGDGTVNSLDDADWSLMILDKEFNLVGEQKFNASEYDFRNPLVTKEGLFIRRNSKRPYKGSTLAGTVFKVSNL